MNYNQLRPLRNAPQATPNVLKCTLIALLIIFLIYFTIPSSPVLSQHQKVVNGHETIHEVNTVSTASTLAKTMKLLLHQFPARQEISLTFPGNFNQRPRVGAHWKERIETSVEDLSQSHRNTHFLLHDFHTPNAKNRGSESFNGDFIHGLKLAARPDTVQERGAKHGPYYDHIKHDDNDGIGDGQVAERKNTAARPLCSTGSCFRPHQLKICEIEISYTKIDYDGSQSTIERAITSRSPQSLPCKSLWGGTCKNLNIKKQRQQSISRYEIDTEEKSDFERLGLVGPTKCGRNPLHPDCHSPHPKAPSVEHIRMNMKREYLVASCITDSKFSQKSSDHESSEKGLEGQLSVRFDIKDDEDEDEDEEHDLEKLIGILKQSKITCSRDPNHTECHCPLLVEHVQANEKGDSSTVSDVKGLKLALNIEGENLCKREKYDEPKEGQCAICTGAVSHWKEISTLSDATDLGESQKLGDAVAAVAWKCSCSPKNTKRRCRNERLNTVIHENQIDPPTAPVNSPGIKAEQTFGLGKSTNRNADFDPSEHINEANVHSSHITQVKTHDHVLVKPESLSDTLIMARGQPCHKMWMVEGACRPTNSNMPKAKNVPGLGRLLLQPNNTFLDSIAGTRCHDKEGTDREICENNNRTGFWVVCALLIVVGVCGILLVLVTLLTRRRHKRPRSRLLDCGLDHKNGASTPSAAVSEVQSSGVGRPRACVMRRIDEDENIETGSVHHYTTLDGATDGWTKLIFHKQRHGKKACQRQSGRFSPTTITRAPRIPTLKLPPLTLATMREVSGLDSESEGAAQGT